MDPAQRALLYTELIEDARRLGDNYLLLLAQHRLGEACRESTPCGGNDKVIPFPGFNPGATFQDRDGQSLWSILLQSAMIPATIAVIVFIINQLSVHVFNGPTSWIITK